jgi:hypothetical protein
MGFRCADWIRWAAGARFRFATDRLDIEDELAAEPHLYRVPGPSGLDGRTVADTAQLVKVHGSSGM